KTLPILRPHQSMDTYLSRFFRDARIRLAFSFQSKYLGMSPFRCPSLFSILSFLEYEYGVFHPIGGCAAVTAAMARIAERLGVEIALDQPVEEILFEGRRAVGVRTREGVSRADALIVNADFARAMSQLVRLIVVESFADELLARLSRAGIPPVLFVRVPDELAAVQCASAARFALGVSIFSRDIAKACALAACIKSGFVLINDLIVPTADPRMPFGGVKASGFGVT